MVPALDGLTELRLPAGPPTPHLPEVVEIHLRRIESDVEILVERSPDLVEHVEGGALREDEPRGADAVDGVVEGIVVEAGVGGGGADTLEALQPLEEELAGDEVVG